MTKDYDELHITGEPLGHAISRDCWCEPSPQEMCFKDNLQTGRKVLVVRHNDYSPYHHAVIISEREKEQDWITQVLDVIYPEKKG